MDFLQQYFQNVFQQAPAFKASPEYARSRREQLEAHLAIDVYGEFHLTDAVRPSMDLKVEPCQGYRHDVYHDEESNSDIPVIMASATKEILFPLFMQLVDRLGESVDVVLESSHDQHIEGHVDFYREHIDMPVLSSMLWDYEEMLLNDGCSGIAVLNPRTPQEIQFDEHKLLIIYGSPLEPYEHILEQFGVPCVESMSFITEADHVHTSSENMNRKFDKLRTDLAIEADFESPDQV